MGKYIYFDCSKKWNGYGKIEDLSMMDKDIIDSKLYYFSEGSIPLYKLLKYLYENNIYTKACCKGGHLSIKTNNLPRVSVEAYIAFYDKNWLNYLSDILLSDPEIEIRDFMIKYYGKNYDEFFINLLNCFKNKEMVNKEKLNEKLNISLSKETKNQGYINALINIGFDEKQIDKISTAYFEFKKINESIKNNNSLEAINENLDKYNEYLSILKQAIDYNNSITLDK